MKTEQGSLFDKRKLKGTLPNTHATTPPAADQTVSATLPAYYAYLGSGEYSKYTPDDYLADLKRFAQFTSPKVLKDIRTVDIQQYVALLKEQMPPKSVSRKVSAIGNYFRWIMAERVLKINPAEHIRAERVLPPLPDVLYDEECDRLLAAASKDPRSYLLVLILLETGVKKAELLELQVANFDFSNKYEPVLWVKHTGKMAVKDRKLKLPAQIALVFADYIEKYSPTETLFPYSARFIEQLLNQAKSDAGLTKKISAGLLRDMFVIRGVKRGNTLEEMFEKLGLAKTSFDDARKKYGQLTSEAL